MSADQCPRCGFYTKHDPVAKNYGACGVCGLPKPGRNELKATATAIRAAAGALVDDLTLDNIKVLAAHFGKAPWMSAPDTPLPVHDGPYKAMADVITFGTGFYWKTNEAEKEKDMDILKELNERLRQNTRELWTAEQRRDEAKRSYDNRAEEAKAEFEVRERHVTGYKTSIQSLESAIAKLEAVED